MGGQLSGRWPPNDSPTGLAIDPSGDILVSASSSRNGPPELLLRFSPEGAVLGSKTSAKATVSYLAQLGSALIAVGASQEPDAPGPWAPR